MAQVGPIGSLVLELNRRASEGFKHAPFQMAFFVGVVLCGGLGVWLEAYRILKTISFDSVYKPELLAPLRTAIATFFPAILGATTLQMVFEDEIKAHRGAATCALILFLLLLLPITDPDWPNLVGILLGLVASAVSLWIWCAANGLSASFQQSPDAPLGDKDLDADLSGGDDLAGITH